MPDIDALQDEYGELTREINRQNELRDSGSDDYDWNKLDQANNRRNQVRRSIEDAGGTPGGEPGPSETPSGGQTGGQGAAPQTPPDPNTSTIGQLEQRLGSLRADPPHPGVRMEDGKVVGGTAEELQEQLNWRGQVEQLEHELTAAQADKAWADSGGPDGFTDEELEAIEQAGETIDEIQGRLDSVNSEIAGLEARLDQAKGVLDEQIIEGGGPNAQSGAAIGVGAMINGLLRPLYQQKAAITQELNAALAALAAIITARVRSQLEGSNTEVGLPNDGKGKAAVEDAFLRRVYHRLGLPYPPTGASGLLRGLSGAQSSVPSPVPWVAIAAAFVGLLVIGLIVLMLATAGSDPAPAVAVSPPSVDVVPEDTGDALDDPNTEVVVGDEATTEDDPESDPVVAVPATVTGVGAPYACAVVTHSPLAGFQNSLSFFVLLVLLGGQGGPIPDGTTLTVDAGGVAPNSAPIQGSVAEVPIPIDHTGSYSIQTITAEGPDGPLPVNASFPDISVNSSEGPVDDCQTPDEVLDQHPDWLFPVSGVSSASALWFGDEPPQSADAARLQHFLHLFDEAQRNRDGAALLSMLDDAALDRYGQAQCESYLDEVAGSATDFTLISAVAKPYVYMTDDASTPIPDAWAVQVQLNLGGSESELEMHLRVTDDEVSWFTDCGDPIP